MGGAPDFSKLARAAAISTSFYGAVQRVSLVPEMPVSMMTFPAHGSTCARMCHGDTWGSGLIEMGYKG